MCEKETVIFTTEDGRVLDVTTMVELGGNPQEVVENLGLGTMDRHNFMYKFAEANPAKGKKGGSCNVTQCQRKGASCYNGGTRAYYCTKCWDDIYYSATYGGLQPQEWIKPEWREEDFHYTYQAEEVFEDLEQLQVDLIKQRNILKGREFVSRYGGIFGEDKNRSHMPWVREQPKVGRNDKCPCGSGKKYKKCCEVFNG